MIINEQRVDVSGNLVYRDKIEMNIDAGAKAMVLKALTDMYSDPYTAALREYTSNALDAHIMAGQTRHVEVVLPTRLSPSLIIQDFGIGMSRAELSNYGQFGFSDKRDTNDQIGGFGLGSKSGLAVASQFTVVSVKDGLSNTVTIGRDEKGEPFMGFLVVDKRVDEGNGTKITIPTSESNKFSRAVNDAHMFIGWKPGTIKFGGQEPLLSVYDTSKFSEMPGLGWLAKGNLPGNVADGYNGIGLVGPVAYQIDWNQVAGDVSWNLRRGYLANVVVKIDNGSVDLIPSREALLYSKRTREALAARIRGIVAEGKKEYIRLIEDAPTPREALRLMHKAEDFGFKGPYSYKGRKIEVDSTFGSGLSAEEGIITLTSISKASNPNNLSGYTTYRNAERLSHFASGGSYRLQNVLRAEQTVLVVGAPVAVTRQGRTLHSISTQAGTLARALAERDNTQPNDYTIAFTSLPEGKVDFWVKAAYAQVIKAEDMATLVSDFRKANARGKAATGAGAKAPKVEIPVRTMRGNTPGNCWQHDTTLAEIKAENTDGKGYVLMQAAEGDTFTDYVRSYLLTKVGKDNYGVLKSVVLPVLNSGKYVFLLANKSWDVSEYEKELGSKMLDIKQIILDDVKSAVTSLTPVQRLAAKDKSAGQTNWAQYVDKGWIARVARQETREWLEAYTTKGIFDTFEYLKEAARAGQTFSALKSLDTSAAFDTAGLVSPGKRYPLLWGNYRLGNVEASLEYVNLMDAHLATQGNP